MSSVEEARPRILVITGLSGAGRSTASNAVEDLGWFVIDNLPPTLIDRVTELAFAPGSSVTRLAVVADVRGREFFSALVDTVRDLRRSEADVRVLFLEADEEALVRRFEETRRRHPADTDGGVLSGIRAEREQLTELRGLADLIVDTSDLNVHELRDKVLAAVDDPGASQLRVSVVSFGFKHGTPRDADLLFDVRFLPNPHWVEELRPYSGKDAPVRDYVFGQPATEPFVSALEHLLDVAVPGYVTEGKRYLTIGIGCTGGKHRSVAISDRIGRHLATSFDLPVAVVHRDLGAE
ncbi:MAG: RNase adapter RapZ [Nitriliruptoraceae bacterium]|nr:RNase adapter RapZ [Nitriliruptoraceae bacterium]